MEKLHTLQAGGTGSVRILNELYVYVRGQLVYKKWYRHGDMSIASRIFFHPWQL